MRTHEHRYPRTRTGNGTLDRIGSLQLLAPREGPSALRMVSGGKSTKRVVTHDPVTGAEFPTYVSYVPACKGKRRVPKYRLKVPDSHCREQGINSKSFVFNSMAELLASAAYNKVVADDERHFLGGWMAARKRTDAQKERSVREYERLVSEGVEIHPDITFRHRGAIWSVSRTFGTGWTFRATAHKYAEAVALHRECANVRSIEEVIGDETTVANKHKKIPFSRKALARVRAEAPREAEEEEGEEVVVDAVEVVQESEEEEDDEEEEEVVVEGVTFRSSRSGRVCKRPNLYAKEAERPQQGKRKVAAVVGRPVLAVAVEKAPASTSEAGPSSLGASIAAPIPVYDDADAMQSLKAIRERIAHLL